MTCIVRPHQGDDDTIFIPPLASIGRKNLHTLPRFKQIRQELDLLAIERDNANLVLRYPGPKEGLRELVDEGSFHFVLHQISYTRIVGRNLIGVDKDRFTAKQGPSACVIPTTEKRSPFISQLFQPAITRAFGFEFSYVKPLQERAIGKDQASLSNFFRSTPQSIVVYEPVRQQHNVFVHPVLVSKVHNCIWVGI